jgi:hypothetical protein
MNRVSVTALVRAAERKKAQSKFLPLVDALAEYADERATEVVTTGLGEIARRQGAIERRELNRYALDRAIARRYGEREENIAKMIEQLEGRVAPMVEERRARELEAIEEGNRRQQTLMREQLERNERALRETDEHIRKTLAEHPRWKGLDSYERQRDHYAREAERLRNELG